MSFLHSAARAAARDARDPEAPPRPDRRAVMGGAAGLGAAGLLGLAPTSGQAASARIAVVGAGLAGLTAAYRLQQAGLNPVVFEGNTRLGGRCYTARGAFADGQIAEHGGEFIDTDHHAIRALASELGLTLYDVLAAQPAGTQPLYRFNGQRYTLADATVDFGPLYKTLQAQKTAIGDTVDYQTSTPAARQFDTMSAHQWIAAFVPGGHSSKLGQLINNAFTEENAADTGRQSALNIILTLADDPKNKFNLYYTDSDQRFRVSGGNDQIVSGLAAKLGPAIRTGSTLFAVATRPDGRVRLTFSEGAGTREATFDRVILAIPFSILRSTVDLGRAGFSALKMQAISTLGMGQSVKFQLQTSQRLWDNLGCNGEIRLVSKAFQTTWDATRGQAGPEGIFNFWSGGAEAAFSGAARDPQALAALCLAGASEILPGLAPLWNGRYTLDVWAKNPWSLGSYSYYPVGYQTTLLGVEGLPEGNVFFAGEHTWSQAGYLNAGVASGDRAAGQLRASLGSNRS